MKVSNPQVENLGKSIQFLGFKLIGTSFEKSFQIESFEKNQEKVFRKEDVLLYAIKRFMDCLKFKWNYLNADDGFVSKIIVLHSEILR